MNEPNKLGPGELEDLESGNLHGIRVVLLALANTHPHKKDLLNELNSLEQFALAQVESSLLSDRYMQGMREIVGVVRKLLRKHLGLD
jgi:hypothetical protein